MRFTNKSEGYTLIELMVVVVISLLAIGGAIVSVYQFNKKQGLDQDAKNFVVELRKTYGMAIGNVQNSTGSSSNCQVINYKITWLSENQYRITNQCGYVANLTLPNSIFGIKSFEITLMVGSGDTTVMTSNNDNKIEFTDGVNTKVVSINNYGDFTIKDK